MATSTAPKGHQQVDDLRIIKRVAAQATLEAPLKQPPAVTDRRVIETADISVATGAVPKRPPLGR